MQEINRFLKVLIIVFFSCVMPVESKILSIGSSNAKITIKVFSSLTCPHCANFHNEIFNDLKKDFIDKGLVRFEHHPFPLDLAALNAEIILGCKDNSKVLSENSLTAKNFELLSEMYAKQKNWAIGSDINKINELIKKIGLDFGLSNEEMNICLKNERIQDMILEQRIEAQKIYKIESTPTIFINDKKYTSKVDYKTFKKLIEKNL